jgi:hypothetical protein
MIHSLCCEVLQQGMVTDRLESLLRAQWNPCPKELLLVSWLKYPERTWLVPTRPNRLGDVGSGWPEINISRSDRELHLQQRANRAAARGPDPKAYASPSPELRMEATLFFCGERLLAPSSIYLTCWLLLGSHAGVNCPEGTSPWAQHRLLFYRESDRLTPWVKGGDAV